MSVELATAYVNLQVTSKGLGKEIAQKMGAATPAAAKEGADAGKKFTGKFSDGLKKGMAAAGAAGGLIAAKGFVDAAGKESSNDLIASRLGLDPKEAKRIGKIAGGLYAKAYGDDLGQVNDAIDGIQGNIGDLGKFSNKELESMSASALDLSKIMDEDVGRVTRGVGQLMRNGMATDATEAFDLITAASQKLPKEMRGELLDTIEEYSADLSSLGITGPQAMGALSNAVKAGARNTDLAADALRELSIRGIDGSKSTAAGFKALGLDAEDMAAKLAAGGPSAQKATSEIIQALGGMSDPIAQEAAGVALFGTRYEELGPKAIAALDPATAGLEDYEGAAKRAGDTLNDNTATRIEEFKRKASDMASDLAAKAIPKIETFGKAFSNLPTPIQGTIAGLGGLAVVAGPVNNAVEGAKGLASSIKSAGSAAGKAGSKMGSAASKATTLATNMAKTAATGAKAAITGVGNAAKAAGTAALSGAKSLGAWALASAKSAASALASAASIVAQKAAMIAGKVATATATAAQWLWNAALTANPIGLVIAAIVGIVAALVLAYNKVDWFKAFVDGAFRLIGNVVGWVVEFIKNNWKTLLAILTGPIGLAVLFITKNWDKITAGFRAVKEFITGAISAIGDWFTSRWQGIAKTAASIVDGLKRGWDSARKRIVEIVVAITNKITGIKDRVTGSLGRVFDALRNGVRSARDFVSSTVGRIISIVRSIPRRIGNMATAISEPFKWAFSRIAQFWNNTAGRLSFTAPTWVPGIGGKGFSMPRLPAYHQGGEITGGRKGQEVPIMALVGESVNTIAETDAARSGLAAAGAGNSDPFMMLRGARVELDVSGQGALSMIRRAELVRR